MNTRYLLSLLYASVFGILFILSLVVGYGLSVDDSLHSVTASAGVASIAVKAVPPEIKLGRAIWNANGCGSCHALNMKDNSTGPALSGVTERWSAYPREDLFAWIRNSQALIAANHPRAVEVWKENKKRVMANYPDLTYEDIEVLLVFIESK